MMDKALFTIRPNGAGGLVAVILAWLMTASIVSFGYWWLAQRHLNETPLVELQPVMSQSLSIDASRDQLLCKLQVCFVAPEYAVIDEPSSAHLIIDQRCIGAFHWGFVFLPMPVEDGRWKGGVFLKGLNPPRGAVLQRHLEKFCASIEQDVAC